MGKIILTADLHLGHGDRSDDILWAMDVVSKYAVSHNIEYIVVLGDLNHDRKHLPVDVACATHAFFQDKRATGQEWVLFPGNHDMHLKHSWNINSLEPFEEVATVIDDVKIIMFDNRRFWVLPFVYSESAYMAILKRIERQYQHQDVLLTHIGVKSATLNRCFMLQSWSVVDFTDSKFDQVYTGHFHVPQQVGDNVYYPGSLLPFKLDEGDVAHGFMVYDLESRTHEFVDIWDAGREYKPLDNYPPQFLTIADTDLNDKSEKEIKDNIIRVALTSEASQSVRESMRSRLIEMGARKISFLDLKSTESSEPQEYTGNVIPVDQLFLKWVEQDEEGSSKLDKKLLLRIDSAVRHMGDEIYSSSIGDN